MKQGFKVFGHVNSQGILRIYHRDVMEQKLKRMSRTSVEIEILEQDEELQNNWRSYYFAVVVKEWKRLLHYLGNPATLADTDTLLRQMFLFKEKYNPETDTWSKEIHTLRAGETEVSQKEFRFFIDQCIKKAAELDWEIPYPNEQLN